MLPPRQLAVGQQASAFVAAHAADQALGSPRGYDAERSWQAEWLARRLGLSSQSGDTASRRRRFAVPWVSCITACRRRILATMDVDWELREAGPVDAERTVVLLPGGLC